MNVRSRKLDNTAVPLPFEIFAVLESSKFIEVERLIHQMIDEFTELKIRPTREFFNVRPIKALNVFCSIASTVDDAVVTLYKNNQPLTSEENDRLLRRLTDAPHRPKSPAPNGKKRNLLTVKKRQRNAAENPRKSLSLPTEPKNFLINSPGSSKRRSPKPSFRFNMAGLDKGDKLIFDPTGAEVTVFTDKTIEYHGKEYSLSGFTKEFLPQERKTFSGAYQGPKYFSFHGTNLLELRIQLESKNSK